MGLDQWAYATQHGVGKKSGKIEIATWRKHHALDEIMADMYYSKYDWRHSFNQRKLELDESDLDSLEIVIEDLDKPLYADAFDERHKEELRIYDLNFIYKARFYLNNRDRVYYTNWW